MKYAPKKVFILEDGNYREITYEELCQLTEDNDNPYADKLFLPLHGMLMEVTPEQYAEFYRVKNRQRYLDRRSADNGDISVDMLTTDEFNGADILIDTGELVDEQVIRRVLTDKLIACFSLLEKEEQALIHDLFYVGLTERNVAEKYAVSQVAIHKRKQRILQKLKKMIDC